MLSRVTAIWPDWVTTCLTKSPTKPIDAPVAGRAGPVNVPRELLIPGAFGIAALMLVPRPKMPIERTPTLSKFDPGATGVALLVTRGDSSELGPDWIEFTSNAVTA